VRSHSHTSRRQRRPRLVGSGQREGCLGAGGWGQRIGRRERWRMSRIRAGRCFRPCNVAKGKGWRGCCPALPLLAHPAIQPLRKAKACFCPVQAKASRRSVFGRVQLAAQQAQHFVAGAHGVVVGLARRALFVGELPVLAVQDAVSGIGGPVVEIRL